MLDFKILKFYAIRADFCAEGGASHTHRSFLSLVTGPCFFGDWGKAARMGASYSLALSLQKTYLSLQMERKRPGLVIIFCTII